MVEAGRGGEEAERKRGRNEREERIEGGEYDGKRRERET